MGLAPGARDGLRPPAAAGQAGAATGGARKGGGQLGHEVVGLSPLEVTFKFGSTHVRRTSADAPDQKVTVYDARGDPGRFSLERHGFELASAPGLGARRDGGGRLDLYDAELAVRAFFPQVEQLLLRRFPGASRAIAFDHIVRNKDRLAAESAMPEPGTREKPKTKFLRGALDVVHGDYTARSGRTRAEQLLRPWVPEEDVQAALSERFVIINVWHPFETVQADPLALCTFPSCSPSDVRTNRLHFKHRVGETYKAFYSERQHWIYFSEVTNEEAILLKTFDSVQDGGEAMWALHTAFGLPGEESRPCRECMEVRVLLLFGQGLESLAPDFQPPHMTGDLDLEAGELLRSESMAFGEVDQEGRGTEW